jgi:hypothetical protein
MYFWFHQNRKNETSVIVLSMKKATDFSVAFFGADGGT